MVDTGAAISVLSSGVWNKLHNDKKSELEQLEGVQLEVANEEVLDTCGITNMKMELDDTVFEWPMVVAPIKDDALLGSDFLHKHEYIVDSKGCLELDGV